MGQDPLHQEEIVHIFSLDLCNSAFSIAKKDGFAKISQMKLLVLCAFCLSLVSCNTAIGMYRDAKEGVIWTKNKIQEKRGGGGQSDPYGAPTY